jgi:hypothetical protein
MSHVFKTALLLIEERITVFYAHLGWPNFILLRIACVTSVCPIFLAQSLKQAPV